jgi:hypothetical protein
LSAPRTDTYKQTTYLAPRTSAAEHTLETSMPLTRLTLRVKPS